MDSIVQFLLDYGYWGMLIASFLAGTVVPFSSELIMVTLIRMGLNPMLTILVGTLGNVMGGMTGYWIGHLGNMKWIERYFGVSPQKLERAKRFVNGRGAWMGLFCFIPFIGEAITIVLGLMRANVYITLLSMTIGKFSRYAVIVYVTEGVATLF